MSNYILELKDVVKTFGGVTALNNVQFQLKRGEVHALMGENGAGKSTFIKVITGVHQPDSGIMLLEGESITLHSTSDSAKLGIAAIYQHVTAFPDLSVTENIFMGQEIMTPFHTYNWTAMTKRAKALIAPLSQDIDVTKPMNTLSVAQQQLVEIAKALSRDARIIIMDEPTASLTKTECEELYQIVERLRDDGVSIIFITHKFEDMYRLATRVTVFRDSQYIGTWDVDKISNSKLIAEMVGRELDQMYPHKTSKIGDVVLEVNKLSKEGYFKDISFKVRKGEILALTGLVGAGRTEVCQTLFGIMTADSGSILLEGNELTIKSPIDALKNGIGLLPEDRQLQGLVCELPIYQNVSAPVLKNFLKKGLLDQEAEIANAIELCSKIQVKAKDIVAPPSSLSGGNQQKVVFSKLLSCDLKVLILDEPTKGIDVGAKYSIYEIMNELASNGYAIIVVSSEMPEVLGTADRIVVMKSGRVTGEFAIADATQEKILEASLMKHSDTEQGA
ncbi:D-xylose ABC transporter ATP-binding protein [Sporanaerobium hydrogeniformans]|uniref:D-xylose ABC transporter ATP-binding protein n=1 Tax=Sporanaerobium hydrogeniformans TaxID=3072179 RepID=A0AC61DAC4_9FIRM|nr:sugar ABC transporter ATP-binding protein [Sporanaerobium hydrogeniformans]PHV70249.1 D-xylose ABC transporter ATP-binding protein [Sporanaerobium hydrogeniformans]